MRASIVVATYNDGEALTKTVRSCIETYSGLDCEIVVVDDASWDGSVEEVERRFPRLRVLRNAERLGPSPTKDRGARAASGQVLIFLDGHAKPERGALRRLVEDVELLRGRAVVTPTIVALDVDRWRNAAASLGQGYRADLETLRGAWLPLSAMRAVREGARTFYESPAAIGCAFAVSRELYETLWGFDPDMRAWGVEDVDFSLKCWLMGHPVLHDPEPVIGHRFRHAFDYEVPRGQLAANEIRFARKNFTHGVWEAWVELGRRRHAEALPGHPEGLWTHAWQVFESRRASVEEERSYLMSRRTRDELWYADRFGLPWPRLVSTGVATTAPFSRTERAAPLAFGVGGGRAFSATPSPPPPPPPDQPGCSVPGQPDDSSGCPCGSGGGAPGGGGGLGGVWGPGGVMLRSFGIPSWSVNLFSLNLIIRDTPAFYSPGLGPQVAWDLTYNSANPNDPADVGPFDYLFGPDVSCPYLAHVVDLGDVAHVVMPDGRTDWYYPTNPGSNPIQYAPAATTGVFNILVKDTTNNQFTLALSDHSTIYTFGKPFTFGGIDYYALTRLADPYDQALALGYSADPMPRLLTLTDANGNVSQIAYNVNGQASQIDDPFGGNVQFGYTSVNGRNRLSAITDQADYTSLLGYDVSGRLTSLTTPVTAPDPTWRFAYSGTGGQIASVTDPYDNVRSYATTSAATTRIDELGRTTIYDFSNNAFGGAGTVTDALGYQTRQTFDDDRNVIQVVNARDYFSRFTYDDNGNRLTQTDYLNPYPDTSVSIQRSWTYDGNNNVLSATDPLGNTESWTYNANNQPLTWTDKLGHTASYTYNGLGQLLTVTDRNGITAVTNTYNTTGRLVSTADALSDTTQFVWDARGRRIQVTNPAGNATAFTYDLLDRVTVTTFPDLTTIQNAYNCCQLTQITDQLNNVTQFVHDDLGRLTQVTDPTGAVTHMAYDAVGNQTSMTDPNNHTWQWQYDALNRRTVQIDPLSNQETWAYDPIGNVTSRVDGNNATTSYVYDALSRLAQVAYPDNSSVSLTYDALGNRLTATDALGLWSWTYNANSWMTSATTPLASGTTQYQYDDEGNRAQVTDPDGNAITTTYDQAYRVASVGFPFGGQNQTVSYQRDPRGLITQRTLPNSVVSTYGYDALGRTTSIQHAQSGGTVLFGFAYQYDDAGNLTQETSQRWDTGVGATIAYQADYTYDARYQLTSEKYHKAGSLALELDYTYDPVGNRNRLVTTDPTTSNSPVTVDSTYAADNQISQAVRTAPLDPSQTTTYAEDGNGSLTQAANSATGTTAYDYDFERRLAQVSLPAGADVQFRYDPDDLRVRKTDTGGAVTDYVLDGLQVLLEKDGSGATQGRYVPGLARIASGTAVYYLEDRMGSVVGLADSNQNVTDVFQYDAWGNTLQHQGSTGTPYQWIGEEGYYLNPDAGLYLLGLRYYTARIGMFLTRDPLGHTSRGESLYNYVSSRPLVHIDPVGLAIRPWACITCGLCIPVRGGVCVGMCAANPVWDNPNDTTGVCIKKCLAATFGKECLAFNTACVAACTTCFYAEKGIPPSRRGR